MDLKRKLIRDFSEVAVKRLFGKDDTLSEGFDGGFGFRT